MHPFLQCVRVTILPSASKICETAVVRACSVAIPKKLLHVLVCTPSIFVGREDSMLRYTVGITDPSFLYKYRKLGKVSDIQ